MNPSPVSPEPSIHIGAHTRAQVKEIVYCEGDRNYSHVHFIRKPSLMLSITLSMLHARLGEEGFLRISRSVLVNTDYIAHYDGREIVLHNGRVLPIARRRRKQVETLLKAIFQAN